MAQRASQEEPKSQAGSPRGFKGNRAHLARFLDAIDTDDFKSWDRWRKDHPAVKPDLRGLDLAEHRPRTRLKGVNLVGARLAGADFSDMQAWEIQLAGADLTRARFDATDLSFANLRNAALRSARLVLANLTKADARGADLRDANLSHATLNCVYLQGADLRGAKVAGINGWEIELDAQTRQDGLVLEEVGDFLEDLSDPDETGHKRRVVGRANHLEAVHLLYLIRDKAKFRTVVDAMTSNVVLLLGNFGLRRKALLHALEDKLADLGYLPVIFDFDAPTDRDLIETVSLLANLSCFVIADISQPKSTPLETMLVAPHLGVPLATIIQQGETPFSMFRSLQAKYDWVLPTWTYRDKAHLLRRLKADIIEPCEGVRKRLRERRAS